MKEKGGKKRKWESGGEKGRNGEKREKMGGKWKEMKEMGICGCRKWGTKWRFWGCGRSGKWDFWGSPFCWGGNGGVGPQFRSRNGMGGLGGPLPQSGVKMALFGADRLCFGVRNEGFGVGVLGPSAIPAPTIKKVLNSGGCFGGANENGGRRGRKERKEAALVRNRGVLTPKSAPQSSSNPSSSGGKSPTVTRCGRTKAP